MSPASIGYGFASSMGNWPQYMAMLTHSTTALISVGWPPSETYNVGAQSSLTWL